jgi:nicotinamidase-related amidase
MRRGLQPRKGSRGRAAVLALDLISDFDFPDGSAVRRALAPRIKPIVHLLQTARAHHVPVIYVNDYLGRWRSDAPKLIAHCLEPQRPGAALVRAIVPAEHDFIILKPRHSAFFGTPLEAVLEDLRVDTLVLTGVSAESCVWMSATDAHTRGFQLVVPSNALAGASAPAVRRTLTSLKEVLGARVPAKASALRFGRSRIV